MNKRIETNRMKRLAIRQLNFKGFYINYKLLNNNTFMGEIKDRKELVECKYGNGYVHG